VWQPIFATKGALGQGRWPRLTGPVCLTVGRRSAEQVRLAPKVWLPQVGGDRNQEVQPEGRKHQHIENLSVEDALLNISDVHMQKLCRHGLSKPSIHAAVTLYFDLTAVVPFT